jgi:ATP-binding cassette subfamily F protein 3
MSNLVYEFRDQKIKEYLGDVNYFLEQRNLENMREVEKKDALKAAAQRIVIKLPMKNKKGKHCRIV